MSTPTKEELQEAFEAAVEILGQMEGNVLGFACVVITEEPRQNMTYFAGDHSVVALGLDLLDTRFEESNIEDEMDSLIESGPKVEPEPVPAHNKVH